jgi:hypothetical protein
MNTEVLSWVCATLGGYGVLMLLSSVCDSVRAWVSYLRMLRTQLIPRTQRIPPVHAPALSDHVHMSPTSRHDLDARVLACLALDGVIEGNAPTGERPGKK